MQVQSAMAIEGGTRHLTSNVLCEPIVGDSTPESAVSFGGKRWVGDGRQPTSNRLELPIVIACFRLMNIQFGRSDADARLPIEYDSVLFHDTVLS